MFTDGQKIERNSKQKASSSFLPFCSSVGIGRRCIFLGVLLLIMILFCGCQSVKLDGFSVGVIYLNTDLTTTSSFTGQQSTKVEGIMPVGLLNFRFE